MIYTQKGHRHLNILPSLQLQPKKTDEIQNFAGSKRTKDQMTWMINLKISVCMKKSEIFLTSDSHKRLNVTQDRFKQTTEISLFIKNAEDDIKWILKYNISVTITYLYSKSCLTEWKWRAVSSQTKH